MAAFLGIPYAAPPFGPNRMLPPQPVPAWTGERDATAFGPTVPKGDYPPQYAPLFPEEVIRAWVGRWGWVFEKRSNGVASGGWALRENLYGIPGI